MDLSRKNLEILDQLFDGVYLLDREGRILFWNHAAEEITGFSREEVTGRSCSDGILMHVDAAGRLLCGELCPMRACMADGVPREAEVSLHHKDGHRVPVLVHGAPLRDEQGVIQGAIEIFIENSQAQSRMARIEELERLALLDELVRLPNRRYLQQQLESRLAEFKRSGLSFGLLMLDIDFFKRINDTYGHAAGDAVLRVVARALDAARRPYDVLGRWGGEEFLAILPSVNDTILGEVGERLRLAAEHSLVRHGGDDITLTLSLGGTCVREGDTLDSLFARADALLYQSKGQGRNRSSIG